MSVITPVYNLGFLLEETIQSVISQTYTAWELLLIDDCSSDKITRGIIKKWAKKDKRIKPIYLQANVGAGFSRNAGLELVRGDYVAFLDSDDLWIEEKLAKQIEFLENNNQIDFLYSWYITIDEFGNKQNLFVTPQYISKQILKLNNYILTSTVVCRWSAVKKIRFPAIRKRQDWAYFLKILDITRIAHSYPEAMVYYRKMSNTLSSNRFQLVKPNFILFKNHMYRGNGVAAVLHFLIFLPFYFHNKIFNKKNIPS